MSALALLVATLLVMFVTLGAAFWLAVRLERRVQARKEHERNELRHITGAQPWWGQGPGLSNEERNE